MNAPACQRWTEGRDAWRPAGELIDTTRYEVAAIPTDREAKSFVVSHHYSRSYPAARFRFGLYRSGSLVGVAVFSQPTNNRTLSVLPGEGASGSGVELGRFVLLDEVPGNGETWFLGRAFAELRDAGVRGVVSFSDPMPRHTAEGRVVMPGHVGTIYQAHNAAYLGRGAPATLRVLPDGRAVSLRSLSKIRSRDRGWRYAADELARYGADALGETEDARVWLARWLPLLTRPVRHAGNHKYAWALRAQERRRHRWVAPGGASRAYPKSIDTPMRRAA